MGRTDVKWTFFSSSSSCNTVRLSFQEISPLPLLPLLLPFSFPFFSNARLLFWRRRKFTNVFFLKKTEWKSRNKPANELVYKKSLLPIGKSRSHERKMSSFSHLLLPPPLTTAAAAISHHLFSLFFCDGGFLSPSFLLLFSSSSVSICPIPTPSLS